MARSPRSWSTVICTISFGLAGGPGACGASAANIVAAASDALRSATADRTLSMNDLRPGGMREHVKGDLRHYSVGVRMIERESDNIATQLPWLMVNDRPAGGAGVLAEVYRAGRERIESELLVHGAVLF